MKSKIIEVTNNQQNWGKFMVLSPDTAWERKSLIQTLDGGEPSTRPLLQIIGWSRQHVWVLDLQTGEGIYTLPKGNAAADLDRHNVWVCPMFEPFLSWLYQQDIAELDALPDVLNLPDAAFALYGFRRTGKRKPTRQG